MTGARTDAGIPETTKVERAVVHFLQKQLVPGGLKAVTAGYSTFVGNVNNFRSVL